MNFARIALILAISASPGEVGRADSPDEEWLNFCQSFSFMARDLMAMHQSGYTSDDLIQIAKSKQIAGNYDPVPLEIVIETARIFSEVNVRHDSEGKNAAIDDAEAFHMKVCLERPL